MTDETPPPAWSEKLWRDFKCGLVCDDYLGGRLKTDRACRRCWEGETAHTVKRLVVALRQRDERIARLEQEAERLRRIILDAAFGKAVLRPAQEAK